jgi:hypothetical protein
MMYIELPATIQHALAPLASTLAAAQLTPSGWEYSDSFGNFLVAFRGSGRELTLNRDRGQFIVGGPDRDSLEAAGLWRAFDTAEELLPPLARWLGQGDGA